MTMQQDRRPATGLPPTSAGKVHVDPPVVVDTAPPTRSKVLGALAALACAACCALPFLIAAGLLTGAGAAIAQNVLLGTAGLMVAAAGGAWWLHRRRSAGKAAAAGGSGCASGNCAC
jgi:drug/metabolite transporter (DMT)-like permease